MRQGRTKTQPQIKDKPDVVPKERRKKLMEWVWDNYNVLISVPATDGNFKASLNKASQKDLLRARDYLALHTFGNKNRTRAVQGEIRRRERKAKS